MSSPATEATRWRSSVHAGGSTCCHGSFQGESHRRAAIEGRGQRTSERVAGTRGVHHCDRRSRYSQQHAVRPCDGTLGTERHDAGNASLGQALDQPFRHARHAPRVGDDASLGLVDKQDIEQIQHADRKRYGRRRVEEYGDPTLVRPRRQRLHLSQRNFQLHQKSRRRPERCVPHLRCTSMRIGTGHDGDRVFAVVRNMDERDAGHRVDSLDTREVDAGRVQVDQRGCSKGITPGRAEQRHFRTGAACRQRLVGALAAGSHGERMAGQRLAGLGNSGDAGNQVEIDRPQDHDHQRGSTWLTTPFTSKRLP